MPREGICRTAIHLPIPITVRPWDRTFRLDGVEVTSRLYAGDDTGRLVKLQRSVKVDSRFVPAQQAERYFDVKEEAHRSSAVTITLPIVDGRFATAEAKGDGALTLLGRYAWPIIVLIWLCLMLARTVLSDPQ
jgi:hypothetical protein